MKSVFSMNDLYPFSSPTATTTGETIPEDAERQHYQEKTTVNTEGKTEVVSPTSIFIAIIVFVVVGVFLGLLEV